MTVACHDPFLGHLVHDLLLLCEHIFDSVRLLRFWHVADLGPPPLKRYMGVFAKGVHQRVLVPPYGAVVALDGFLLDEDLAWIRLPVKALLSAVDCFDLVEEESTTVHRCQ